MNELVTYTAELYVTVDHGMRVDNINFVQQEKIRRCGQSIYLPDLPITHTYAKAKYTDIDVTTEIEVG